VADDGHFVFGHKLLGENEVWDGALWWSSQVCSGQRWGDVFARFHAIAARRRSRTRNSPLGLLGPVLRATTSGFRWRYRSRIFWITHRIWRWILVWRSGRCSLGEEPTYPLVRRLGDPQSRYGRFLALVRFRTTDRIFRMSCTCLDLNVGCPNPSKLSIGISYRCFER
jgi:hypothetical protein